MELKRKRISILFFFVFILLVFAWVGLAGLSGVCAQKKGRVIRFEDELIMGDRAQPNFLSLFSKDQLDESPLLKLRENFILEMRRTSGTLYRKVGSEKKAESERK